MSRYRDKEYMKLMNSGRWRGIRNAILQRHPLCAECQRQGRITAATEVHHLIPVERGTDIRGKEELAYNLSNLEPLCHACHLEAHARLRSGTREENERRQSDRAKQFTEKIFSGRPPGGIFSNGGGGL